MRVQLAQVTNLAPIHQHASTTAGVHGWMDGGLESRLRGGQQGLDLTFDIKVISRLLCPAPLQLVQLTVDQAGHAHGLVEAVNGGVGILHAGVTQKHATDFKNPDA